MSGVVPLLRPRVVMLLHVYYLKFKGANIVVKNKQTKAFFLSFLLSG
jgi:hypothetical protein